MAFWVYITDTANYIFLVGKRAADQMYILRFPYASYPTNNTEMRFGTNNEDVTPKPTIPNDVWTHVCFVKDGSITYGYINGVLVGQKTITGTVSNASDYYFGMQNGATYPLTGIEDEILFYNRALTAPEVMWLYNQTPRGCHRKTDRSRRRQRLICKGYDLDGNRETGEAGSGDDVDVVTKVSPADSTSLEDMATELVRHHPHPAAGPARCRDHHDHLGDRVCIRFRLVAGRCVGRAWGADASARHHRGAWAVCPGAALSVPPGVELHLWGGQDAARLAEHITARG